jgi:hypothetical protein
MHRMRWGIGLFLLAVAIVLWIGIFLAYPYTSWGVAEEQVRPSVAHLGVQFALASLLVLAASAFVVFGERVNRRGVRAVIFGTVLLFFFATALARLIWVQFYVLA